MEQAQDIKAGAVTLLAATLEKQLFDIRDAFTTLTAGFNAMRQSDHVGAAIEVAVINLGVQMSPGDKPVAILNRIADAADGFGLDTQKLRALFPDIKAIAEEAEKTNANGFETVKIARKYLRAKKDAKPQ